MDLAAADTKTAAAGFARGTQIGTATVTDASGVQSLQVRKDKDTYYAKSSAVEGAYKVDADLGKALDKGLEDFRNKKLFDFGYSEPNKIEIHDGPKAYFLMRNASDWWSNGKKMDMDSVQSVISKLRDLAADKSPDSGFASPTIDVLVASEDGKRTEKIQIAKSSDGYIAKRENEPALYHVTGGSIEDLRKAAEAVKPAAAGK
jgi:hypothetical protein